MFASRERGSFSVSTATFLERMIQVAITRMYKGTMMAATTARMSKPSRSGRTADGFDDRLLPLEVSFIAIASFSLQDSSVSSAFGKQYPFCQQVLLLTDR